MGLWWFELTLNLKFKSVWIYWTSYQLSWTGESCRFNKGSFPYTQFHFFNEQRGNGFLMRTISSPPKKESGFDHGDQWLSENPLLKWYWFCLYWFTTASSRGLMAKISLVQCNNLTACGWLFNTLASVEVREDAWGGRKSQSEGGHGRWKRGKSEEH